MIEIDTQGMTAGELDEILCEVCNNAPLAYYCPACDFKVCTDCLPAAFKKQKHGGALVCKRCGHVDRKLDTFVGQTGANM